MQYKSRAPEDSIKILNSLFKSLNLDLEYRETYNGITYSEVLLAHNIGFSVNGKGTTKAYCRASSLSEMLERLLNYTFIRFSNPTFSDLSISMPRLFVNVPNKDIMYNMKKLLNLENSTMELQDVSGILNSRSDTIAVKYTNLQNNQNVLYIPVSICDYFIGTNGMAAGNTFSEAFVQAYSEIMERYTVRMALEGKISPDVIPREDLSYNQHLLDSIQTLEKKTSSHAFCCTFEKSVGYPVALLLLFDDKKRVKFRFGAHPSIYYALERCLTEMLQGIDMHTEGWHQYETYAKSEIGDYYQFFLDGKGLPSLNFINAVINSKELYNTHWNFKTLDEAFEKISINNSNLFVSNAYNYNYAVVQLYIPEKSPILSFDKNNFRKFDKSREGTRICNRLLQELKQKEINLYTLQHLTEQLRSLYSSDTLLSDISMNLCPIERQYLKKISIASIQAYLNFRIALSNQRLDETAKDLNDHEKKLKSVFNLNICDKCPRCGRENCILTQRGHLTKRLELLHEKE